MIPRPVALACWLVLAALLVVAACGGGGDGELADEAASAAEDTAAEDDEQDDAFEDPFSVDQRVWHAGFVVELGDGLHRAVTEESLSDERVRYFVSIDATFENLGEETRRFGADVVLSSGGRFHRLSRAGTDLPEVPAGLTGSGRMVFEVMEGLDVSRSALVIGSPRERQTHVPLGPGGGELVAVEPVDVALSGEISLALLDLRVTSGELRADRPANYTQVEDSKLALTLHLDAVSRRSGNWSIGAGDFALVLPSGSALTPDGSGLGSLPGSDEGIDTSDLYVRFLVDDPPAGDYVLRFTAPRWFTGDDGVTDGTIELTLN